MIPSLARCLADVSASPNAAAAALKIEVARRRLLAGMPA